MKINILCPCHAIEEEITIPESYLGKDYQQGKEVIFEGDIPCNPVPLEAKTYAALSRRNEGACILHVKIHFQESKTHWVEKLVKK